jgi:hypothetical protein
MSDAVDPSEIIIERGRGERVKEATLVPNPWFRFLARTFDYSLFLILLGSLRRWGYGQLPFGKFESFIPFEFFVWIPVEALLLSTWGSTPGKFFLGLKLRCSTKMPKLNFMSAFHRSLSVWFRGLGLGIPFFSFFCLLFAYNRFKMFQTTSWDRDAQTTVTQSEVGQWRVVVASAIFLPLFYLGE